MNRAYLTVSFLCGVVWGGLAFLLGSQVWPKDQLIAGVLASPIIGLLVGVVSSPAYNFHWGARLFVPPVLLYMSATLFALAMSIRGHTEADLPHNILGVLAGTTMCLYLLLPLAYGTHYGLAAFRTAKSEPH